MKLRSIVTLAAGAAVATVATLAVPASAQTPSAVDTAATQDASTQYIVKFKAGADRGALLKSVGARLGISLTDQRELAVGGHVVTADRRTAGLLAALQASGQVEYAEPDTQMYALSTPNDPSYPQQWHYFEPTAGMNLPGAWDLATGTGVVVAVLDTGKTSHPDLDSHWLAGYDFISSSTTARDGNGRDANPQDQGDWYAAGECGSTTAANSSWHGTHVAGTIAALGNNSLGVAGVAYDAKILPVRVLGKCGGTSSDIADAIVWASGGTVSGVPANPNPAKVINLSLGGSGTCSTTYRNAISSANSRGTTVVVAAGNSNANASGFTPANCAGVVTVAALDRAGNRAFYSNFGATVEVSAPGGEVRLETDPPGTRSTPQDGILSTLNDGLTTPGNPSYTTYMGTSMAAPHVAGLVALMLSKKPTLTPAQVLSALQAHTRPIPGTCTGGCGTGLVDAAATVAAL
ncbi:extracellular protease [Catellatospora sp. TT07R-123]|uniref:S8 family peptidase n=1 Tax=Catellatospora sp. TT07R-123 TaxID=2733863 RepID=UPI001B02B911|nr:S8 family peptidase [Catellatospora sp. TT07R-123]GHJ46766.1 extracellular protease [Catellatospora sp. TT07R-123]